MAKPMTHEQFIDLLQKWHIPYESNSRNGIAWYDHNRNHKGAFGPVNGIVNHHTGGNDDKAGADVLWNGYGDLPGPLCHGGIRSNGHILLNGWGRTNHAGKGDDDVLDAVIEEDYTGILVPNEANTDGNIHFYGFEWMYRGDGTPPEPMYRTAVRVNAAICTFHNWKPQSCIGHKEWQPGKPDPGHVNMAIFRNHVEQAIKEGPNPPKPPAPAPKPTTYTVKAGDTLSSIAKYALGDAKRWPDLISANPSLIRALKPGEKLNLPKG